MKDDGAKSIIVKEKKSSSWNTKIGSLKMHYDNDDNTVELVLKARFQTF